MKALDTLVIGTGRAGKGGGHEARQGRAAGRGHRGPHPGGRRLYPLGTIPSKALRHNIQMLADYRRNPVFQHSLDQVEIEFPDLLRAADAVITEQVRTRAITL